MCTHANVSAGLFQVETRPWTIELPSRKLEIDLTTVSSNHHVELNPSDAGNNDRYVVQEVIKVNNRVRRHANCMFQDSCHWTLTGTVYAALRHHSARMPRNTHDRDLRAAGAQQPIVLAGPVQQEMARSRPIDSKGKKGFKVLVLNEVDRLTKEAQHSLRRTMEKYSAACRLVLCCNNASRVRRCHIPTTWVHCIDEQQLGSIQLVCFTYYCHSVLGCR